jgi:hypothetical protein
MIDWLPSMRAEDRHRFSDRKLYAKVAAKSGLKAKIK